MIRYHSDIGVLFFVFFFVFFFTFSRVSHSPHLLKKMKLKNTMQQKPLFWIFKIYFTQLYFTIICTFDLFFFLQKKQNSFLLRPLQIVLSFIVERLIYKLFFSFSLRTFFFNNRLRKSLLQNFRKKKWMHDFVVLRNKYPHSSIHDEVEGFKKRWWIFKLNLFLYPSLLF